MYKGDIAFQQKSLLRETIHKMTGVRENKGLHDVAF